MQKINNGGGIEIELNKAIPIGAGLGGGHDRVLDLLVDRGLLRGDESRAHIDAVSTECEGRGQTADSSAHHGDAPTHVAQPPTAAITRAASASAIRFISAGRPCIINM